MREHTQSRILVSLLLGLILLALCLPVCAFAEDAEFSDGDEAGISLTTTVPPEITVGAGAEYHKGGTDGLTFKTDDAKDNLLHVLVDGQAISSDKYTVSGEPLTITLHADYLDTLSAGEHTIEIVTTNGSASAKFVIKSEQKEPTGDIIKKTPETGDNTSLEFYIGLCALSMAALLALLSVGRFYKKR